MPSAFFSTQPRWAINLAKIPHRSGRRHRTVVIFPFKNERFLQLEQTFRAPEMTRQIARLPEPGYLFITHSCGPAFPPGHVRHWRACPVFLSVTLARFRSAEQVRPGAPTELKRSNEVEARQVAASKSNALPKSQVSWVGLRPGLSSSGRDSSGNLRHAREQRFTLRSILELLWRTGNSRGLRFSTWGRMKCFLWPQDW